MSSSCHTWDPSSHIEIGPKLNRSGIKSWGFQVRLGMVKIGSHFAPKGWDAFEFSHFLTLFYRDSS